MKPAISLGAALACAALAIGIVSVDVIYSVEARVERQEESGAWTTVADTKAQRYPEAYPMSGVGCPSLQELRLTIENHRPFAATREVRVVHQNGTTGATQVLLQETWTLEAFQSRSWTLAATPGGSASAQTGPRPGAGDSLSITVGQEPGLYLYACVGGKP